MSCGERSRRGGEGDRVIVTARHLRTVALRLGLVALVAAAPAGRQTLGQFGSWGAFRDAAPARCFAITQPVSGRRGQAALAISAWPRLRAHDQLNLRLSRAADGVAVLETGGQQFALSTRGENAWAGSAREDARIASALRGGGIAQVRGVDARGRRFHDRYPLDGAASAIDAMRLACLPD